MGGECRGGEGPGTDPQALQAWPRGRRSEALREGCDGLTGLCVGHSVAVWTMAVAGPQEAMAGIQTLGLGLVAMKMDMRLVVGIFWSPHRQDRCCMRQGTMTRKD